MGKGVFEKGRKYSNLVLIIKLTEEFEDFVRVAQNLGAFKLNNGHLVERREFLLFRKHLFKKTDPFCFGEARA